LGFCLAEAAQGGVFVRVDVEDGEEFGVMDTRDAIRTAREKGMDLVEVAPNADPPVCKIIDFGRFQYLAKKKANEAKKKQVVIVVINFLL